MPYWSAFAGFAGVVLVLLLFLAKLSYGDGRPSDESPATGGDDGPETAVVSDEQETAVVTDEHGTAIDAADDTPSADGGTATTVSTPGRFTSERDGSSQSVDPAVRSVASDASDGDRWDAPHGDPSRHRRREAGYHELTTGELLLNVMITQGVFAVLLAGGAWYARIPPAAFGLGGSDLTIATLGAGVVFGLVLAVLNQIGTAASDRLGFASGDELRRLLTPNSILGWAVLLVVVLPIIAGFEELLFRGALVGVVGVGFGVSPWLLVVLSSIAFALGHGAQGPSGIVVTGALGFVLATGFVLTGSLVTVVVAHYLVNVLEFTVHGIRDTA